MSHPTEEALPPPTGAAGKGLRTRRHAHTLSVYQQRRYICHLRMYICSCGSASTDISIDAVSNNSIDAISNNSIDAVANNSLDINRANRAALPLCLLCQRQHVHSAGTIQPSGTVGTGLHRWHGEKCQRCEGELKLKNILIFINNYKHVRVVLSRQTWLG